ncbi:hypothetical protein GGI35DRAFT_172300 [Trichoderma velutinum]
MDILGTVVAAGNLITQFLSALTAYSDDAESLLHRFNWDLRVINKIIDYFEERRLHHPRHELTDDDEKLLGDTAKYLAKLASKAAGSMRKIQGTGLLQRGRNQVMWLARRSELQELEAELYEWSTRFDIKLLALPAQFKSVLPASGGDDAPTPPVIWANIQLQKFLALPQEVKDDKVAQMLEDKPPEEITRALGNYTSLEPVAVGCRQFCLASRSFPLDADTDTAEFDNLVSGIGQLAAALKCLDSAVNIGLLHVAYFICDLPNRRFIFAQTAPFRVDAMNTLETLLNRSPFPRVYLPLGQRLRVAHKLAEAVFFLHAAGFVHKNITSLSVVILEKVKRDRKITFPFSIGDPYLMGFDMVRTNDMVTKLEGTRPSETGAFTQGDASNFEIFQHPDRLLGTKSEKYIKNYDIYSLGVVLLEIGRWEPMKIITARLSDDPVTWREGLLEACTGIEARIGARYQNLVAWCLNVKKAPIVKDADFVQEVLDPLDDMARALS